MSVYETEGVSRYGMVVDEESIQRAKGKLRATETVVQKSVPEALMPGAHLEVDFSQKSPRFAPSDPAAYEYLRENGYVVIAGAVEAGAVAEVREEMWAWLEALEFPNGRKISRDDPSTWEDGNWPSEAGTGIVFGFGVGQSSFMWRVRSSPGVMEAFARTWEVQPSELLTSFDGCNFFRPWKLEPKWRTKGKWWHLDQTRAGKQCVQGLVCLTDATPGTGGLCVMPRSNHVYEQVLENYYSGPPDKNFFMIPSVAFDRELKGLQPRFVHCKAGDLCLWDSRVVHCSYPSTEPMLEPKTGKMWSQVAPYSDPQHKWELMRMACYVCMMPSHRATNEVLKQRHDHAFKQQVTSTHWPNLCLWRQGAEKDPGFQLDAVQLGLVGRPRGTIQEFFWQCKHKYQISFSDVWLAASAASALVYCARVYAKNRNQKNSQ